MSRRIDPFYSNLLLSELSEENNEEFVQIISDDEGKELDGKDLPEELPILPLKNTVLFPGVVIPITVGRKKSIRLVKKAYRGDRFIGVLAQKNADLEDPAPEELFEVGTIAKIVKKSVTGLVDSFQ